MEDWDLLHLRPERPTFSITFSYAYCICMLSQMLIARYRPHAIRTRSIGLDDQNTILRQDPYKEDKNCCSL